MASQTKSSHKLRKDDEHIATRSNKKDEKEDLTTAAPIFFLSEVVELVKTGVFFLVETRPERGVQVAGNDDNSEKRDGMMKGKK